MAAGAFYALADAALIRSGTGSTRRLAEFVEAGLGDPRVNRFGRYVGAGLVGTGPLSMRSTGELGLAVAIARNGSGYLDQRARAAMKAVLSSGRERATVDGVSQARTAEDASSLPSVVSRTASRTTSDGRSVFSDRSRTKRCPLGAVAQDFGTP